MIIMLINVKNLKISRAERLSIEMREFINHTDQILTKSLEQYLSQVQREEFLQQQIEQSVRGTLKTSAYTEILSSAVVSILKRDVRRIIFVKEKLFGQQLSNTLRQWIWAECLFRLGKKPFNTDLVKDFDLKNKDFIFLSFRSEFH